MADPSITIRVSPQTKEEIQEKIDAELYRSATDFINRAIVEKLERERIDDRTRFKLLLTDLIKTDQDIQALIFPK